AVVLALRIPRTKNNISGTLPALNLMDQVFAMKLGEGTRDVLQLYQKARRAISDCDDLILPELIVAAQQSAGKSMLLTQLLGGGVTFPSATGTCTKCPTVVYSKWSAGPQKCTFKKRFFFDDVSKTELNEVQVHPGPASDSELKGTQEVTAETWNLIPNEIAKLQKEILKGPGKDLKLEFSHNEIIVEVEGSEFPDLIIKDLPGLVAGMDKRLCEALQSITERSMEKTNAIILACITCETHSDNQGILELARKFDKEGRRTIGVLTKPDRIEATTEKPWIELLNNAHKPLKYGWYVVRCPDQKQYRDQISNSMARENETRFFDEEDVGKKMKSAQPDRCGINKLLACASSIVADLVRVQVPVLRTRICQNIETYKAEYDRLFESCGVAVPEDRIRDHLLKVIGDVCRPMEDVLRRSDRTSSVLWQSVREKLRIARKKLEKTVPTSKPPPQATRAPAPADGGQPPEEALLATAGPSQFSSASVTVDGQAVRAPLAQADGLLEGGVQPKPSGGTGGCSGHGIAKLFFSRRRTVAAGWCEACARLGGQRSTALCAALRRASGVCVSVCVCILCMCEWVCPSVSSPVCAPFLSSPTPAIP
ncbi:unnamed protein product, partial [Prorocentrum cordatum]